MGRKHFIVWLCTRLISINQKTLKSFLWHQNLFIERTCVYIFNQLQENCPMNGFRSVILAAFVYREPAITNKTFLKMKIDRKWGVLQCSCCYPCRLVILSAFIWFSGNSGKIKICILSYEVQIQICILPENQMNALNMFFQMYNIWPLVLSPRTKACVAVWIASFFPANPPDVIHAQEIGLVFQQWIFTIDHHFTILCNQKLYRT